jgi:CRP/FNR family transcriptional regulator, cyclic AMP receptor protein
MLTARREKRQRLEALRRVPFFAACTTEELARIDGLGAQIDVAPGRVLTREGAAGLECFVALEGVAVAHRAGTRIGTISAGSIAGEMALIDHTPRNATVVADTSMRLLVLDEREFSQLRGIAPGIEATLLRITSERRDA